MHAATIQIALHTAMIFPVRRRKMERWAAVCSEASMREGWCVLVE